MRHTRPPQLLGLLLLLHSTEARLAMPCADARAAYGAQCCGADPASANLSLPSCVDTPIGCADGCPRVAGTAYHFAQLLHKPRMCVALAAPADVDHVMAVPRQMAFTDAVTRSYTVDLYDASGALLASRTKEDVPYLVTTLAFDPFGRAGEPPATNVTGASGVSRVCYTVTAVRDYAPPATMSPDEWGDQAPAIAAYQAYVRSGTWNVGLVKLGLVGPNGALLPRAAVLETSTITSNGGGGEGYSAYDALRNAYEEVRYAGMPTLTSWSWSGWQTVSASGAPNVLRACA